MPSSGNDCSQGVCSFSCPQWCYVVFPEPPPLVFPDDDGDSPNCSPYLIAIIGVLATGFLLVSYYAIISNYCTPRRNRQDHDFHLHSGNPSFRQGWHSATYGLDEAGIRMITVCEYRRGDGLVGGTECSVCLNEFRDGDNVRLLPKCPHAFHVNCIDTWLRSHASCPLCRAGILAGTQSPPLTVHPPTAEVNRGVAEDRQRHMQSRGDVVIEIPDGEVRGLRRSVSMDNFTVANILEMEADDDDLSGESSSDPAPGATKFGRETRGFHGVSKGVAIKRSFSSGMLFLGRQGRGRGVVSRL